MATNAQPSWQPIGVALSTLLESNKAQLDIHREIAMGTVRQYARMETPFPAIWIDEQNRIVNGHHRVLAAELRGDGDVLAIRKNNREW